MNDNIETRFRMVKEWLSSEEIRALDLPGMPKSRAAMNHWLKQRREANLIPRHQLRRMPAHWAGWEYHRDFIGDEVRAGALFFTAFELADMRLPGMPLSGKGVAKMMHRRLREGLIPADCVRRRFEMGGGRCYHFRGLPDQAAKAFEAGLAHSVRPRQKRPHADPKRLIAKARPPLNEDYRPSPDAVLAQLGILVPGARLVIRVPARTRRLVKPASAG